MSDLQIEPAGGGSYDLVLQTVNGVDDFVLIGDDEASWPSLVQQRVTYAVGTWLEESPFDRSLGFPWEQAVFGRQPVEGIVAYLYEKIIAVDGVEALAEPPVIELNNATRQATITVQALGQAFEATVQQIIQEPVG